MKLERLLRRQLENGCVRSIPVDPMTGSTAVPRPTASLPPPPPPPALPPLSPTGREAVAGQLTIGWRMVTGITWALVIVAYVAVWKTSRELGLSTWWLGPLGDPRPAYITMLPFVAPLVMLLLTVNNSRVLPWAGLAAAALQAAIGALDLGRVPGIAAVELAIAGAAALVAVAGLGGRYRRSPEP
jgi:hypothetical protein